MKVQPVGLPAPMEAWRNREEEPLLTLRCGVDACGVEVGAAYRSPRGVVLESRTSVPQEQEAEAMPFDLAGFGGELGIVGLLDDVEPSAASATPPASGGDAVRAQVDLLNSDIYWHDPTPLCPEHGTLRLDRDELAAAVNAGETTYEALPAQDA